MACAKMQKASDHFRLFLRRLLPRNVIVPGIVLISSSLCLAGQKTDRTKESPDNPWSGSFETQLGYESNVNEVNRYVEPVTSSWYSESALELTHSVQRGSGSYVLTLQAEYKTFFSSGALDEFLLQPGVLWQGDFSDDVLLEVNCHAGFFRAKVQQAFVNEPNETEEGVGAGAGFEFEKNCPDHTVLKWGGRIEGELFEYQQGSNLGCNANLEAERLLGNDITVRAGVTWEWQAYRKMRWSGQPNDEPPELNTMGGRAFAGFSGSWSKNWKWEMSLIGGPDFDLERGYYNALTVGLRSKLIYQVGNWTLSLRVDPQTAIFSNRPAVLVGSSPPLAVQELWAGTEVVYAISPGWELFGGAALNCQWTNGGNSPDASLNSFDDFVVRSGLRVKF